MKNLYSNLIHKNFKNLIFIFIGSFLIAFGITAFLAPNNLLTGGANGTALLLNYSIGYFSIGTWLALINLPFLIYSIKLFGKIYAANSILTIIIVASGIDIAKEFLGVMALTQEPFLAAVFSGLFLGIGIGLIIKSNSSAGATTIISSVIATKTNFKTSEVLLFLDSLIITACYFVFLDMNMVLWSIVSIYITSRLIDKILSGRVAKKTVRIVSNKTAEIAQEIHTNFCRHGTMVPGADIKYGTDKTMIFLVIDMSKIQPLYEAVKKHDRNAFLIITDAYRLYEPQSKNFLDSKK